MPTIVEDDAGVLWAVVGASGGSRIFPAVFQALLNLDWGLDAGQAVEFGRVHDQLFPTYIDADNVYPAELLESLRERGHNVSVADVGRVAAVVQLVVREGEALYGERGSVLRALRALICACFGSRERFEETGQGCRVLSMFNTEHSLRFFF